MSPAEEKGEISNEFFKRLNQQIVQKDNLIKLLQLQIKNLKAQAEEGGAGDGAKKGELQKALEEKEGEIARLQAELDAQKTRLAELEREKNEQIQALNQMLEQGKAAPPEESARVQELEATVARLEQELEATVRQLKQELEAEKAARLDAQKALAEQEKARKTPSEEQNRLAAEVKRLTAELAKREEAAAGLEQQIAELRARLEQADQELQAKAGQAGGEVLELANRVAELEQDNQTLKNLLAEKDEQLAAAGGGAANEASLLAELEVAKKRGARVEELEKLVATLEAEIAAVPELKAKVSHLESESTAMAEAAMKMTALEAEREQLAAQLKERDERISSLAVQVADLNRRLAQKENELADLRVAVESRGAAEDPATRSEIEQLTTQVADQLLAIQRFEELVRKNQEQLTAKDEEIAILRNKLAAAGDTGRPIPINSESEVISSFIDFFDGLDNFLAKNPIPELQTLHRKLLDRLIIPNQISYMSVISETYDETQHIATDYFRSNKFPEKCIVFEVEKGYRKGNMIIKKSKVWVVQNLYHCRSCQALQSNPDSRFCHMCGAKMVAPNGLPVESLPWFEPTPTTYLRFAERMFEQNRLEEAKAYLTEGLALDGEFVPLLVKMAELHAVKSEFPEAIQLLQKAVSLKPDPRLSEQIKALEVKNTIYQQARALNLPPGEFEKLVNLIQTRNQPT
ncbi:MAG: TolA protein [Candidatus Ozemobacter sibiricus]|jgi:chromosome segregation ATPase|uniref:TolA protein n=1 Tax=Candidatus Ozemobacter sibiricus TaxID=2268124 RepID=A0A367ZU25_9BACT|nr:MAG: TolA protein [Candidatus Ozemobacter sibiricus]